MNLLITVVLLPRLFSADDGNEQPEQRVVAAAAAAEVVALPSTTLGTLPPPTTTTVAPPPAPTTIVKPAPAPAPKPKPVARVAAAPRPTTTTTAHPPPPPPPSQNTEEGRATWYELEGARPGFCAHKTLPFGTVVTVTNTRTGKSVQCTVGDRGPYVKGYVIDLYRTDFEQLAPTSQGWFPAKITW